MELVKSIEKGESKTIEFKESIPTGKQISQTVIAFANGAGGKILIGIRDTREIVGIDEKEDIFKVMDSLNAMIYDNCYPNINYDIYTENIEDKIIVVIEVFPGNLKPYYLKSLGKENGTYIRVGASNRIASFENLLELERQRNNITFDEEIEWEKSVENIDISILRKFFTKNGKELSQEKLFNLGLLKKVGEKVYLTKGLGIILGIYENTNINCARFKGKTMDTFLDKKELVGDIFSKIENIQLFLQNHLKIRSEFDGFQRKDFLEIPETALREAIINALVHRDYSNQGRDIKIGIYDDIVEIVSPGSLPSTLTIEQIYSGRSEIRNRVIARIFKELGFIERWGSGINRMINLCKNSNIREPEVRETGDSVSVIFYRISDTATLPPDTATLTIDMILTDKEKEILNFLSSEKKGRKEIEKELKLSSRRTREILKNLQDKGLIIMIGRGPKTTYIKKS